MSISNGVICDESINRHMSQEFGIKGVLRIIGLNIHTVKFKRADRVKPIAVMNTGVRIENKIMPVNLFLIFQRMSIAKKVL